MKKKPYLQQNISNHKLNGSDKKANTNSPFPEKSDQKCPESRFLQSFLLVFSVMIFI